MYRHKRKVPKGLSRLWLLLKIIWIHIKEHIKIERVINISGKRYEILILKTEIIKAVRRVARHIASDEELKGQKILLVGILNGAAIFTADLLRELGKIGVDCTIDFVRIWSYGQATTSSGKIRCTKWLDPETIKRLDQYHLIFVEDIVDSGQSIEWLKTKIAQEKKQPRSVRYITLLMKRGVKQIEHGLYRVGFTIGPEFVVGYGLDEAQGLRYLEHIYVKAQ